MLRNFLLALVETLRNSRLLTPGISIGYWKPRKIPDWALSSGSRELMFSPKNFMSPFVILYEGCPAIIFERVL